MGGGGGCFDMMKYWCEVGIGGKGMREMGSGGLLEGEGGKVDEMR